MHYQMQQLQQRINQLQRELSSISNQLSSLSSMSSQPFSGSIGGGMAGYGISQGQGTMNQSFIPGNISSYTPAQSPKAGVGDSVYPVGNQGQYPGSFSGYGGYGQGSGMSGFSGQQQTYGISDYNYPGGNYGGNQNIASFTGPSATAGFSEVNSSPTGRQDYGIGGSGQAFRLGQY